MGTYQALRFEIRLADPRQLQELIAYIDELWSHKERQLQERMPQEFAEEGYRLNRTIDNPGACGERATVAVGLLLPSPHGGEFIEEVKRRFKVEISVSST